MAHGVDKLSCATHGSRQSRVLRHTTELNCTTTAWCSFGAVQLVHAARHETNHKFAHDYLQTLAAMRPRLLAAHLAKQGQEGGGAPPPRWEDLWLQARNAYAAAAAAAAAAGTIFRTSCVGQLPAHFPTRIHWTGWMGSVAPPRAHGACA